MREENVDCEWDRIIRLNKIPKKSLDDRGMEFVRSVTRQFQEHGRLSSRQWDAIQRCIDYHMSECDFDPNNPEGI
jgi:hypothetical protein